MKDPHLELTFFTSGLDHSSKTAHKYPAASENHEEAPVKKTLAEDHIPLEAP
jgi:hypothetical protein